MHLKINLINHRNKVFLKRLTSSIKNNHFTDPPYSTIKPGYRPSMPMPNLNQLEIKHIYSFSPFGDPKHVRGNKDMFKSTFR